MAARLQDPQTFGELVVQNGRHHGAKRPLAGPLTVIGRAPGCDIRLQMDGVSNQHCLLAQTRHGLMLRDLRSDTGTMVNGEQVDSVYLAEGDLITVGPLQFRLEGLPDDPLEPQPAAVETEEGRRDAWRVQVAAVAAHQYYLEEEEERIEQGRSALQQQQEQLAAHLDEKRRHLGALAEEIEAERQVLAKDRATYESYIGKITGDLTQAQRELMENQQTVERERVRLSELKRRLKQRWHRFWMAERKKIRVAQQELAEQERILGERIEDLQREEERVAAKRLRFNTLYEHSRGQLREAWTKLRLEQKRWKHRRGQERAALKVRTRDFEQAEYLLVQAQRLFLLDQRGWDAKKRALEIEVEGLEQRIANRRERITAAEAELQRLKEQATTPPVPGEETPPAIRSVSLPTPEAPSKSVEAEASAQEKDWHERLIHLQKVSGNLSDQRVELVEQWQRLTLLYRTWQKEKEHAAGELDELANKLLEQGQRLAEREQEQRGVDEALRHRHDDVTQLRHQMIAWRGRLRAKEQTWENERSKLLTEIRHREALAEEQHATLVDLRQRWQRRRREEVELLHQDREAVEALRQELHKRREELTKTSAGFEDEKRLLAEKALALEHFRQELLQKTDQTMAERKLERYRRRWLTQNTLTLRHLSQERQTLRKELEDLDARSADLKKRADALAASEAELRDKQSAWEHQQALAQTRQTRLHEELKQAELQRRMSEQHYEKMREEVERIARAIYSEPDPPTAWSAEVAA